MAPNVDDNGGEGGGESGGGGGRTHPADVTVLGRINVPDGIFVESIDPV